MFVKPEVKFAPPVGVVTGGLGVSAGDSLPQHKVPTGEESVKQASCLL